MSNPISFTLKCSKKGVHLLEMGRLGAARHCFREAFRVMIAVKSTLTISFERENMFSSLHSELDCYPIVGWSDLIPNRSTPATGKDDNSIFVYSRAIQLHEKQSSSHHEMTFYMDIYSICVAYNLGLSYHLMAMSCAKSQSWSYRQACALYEQAMRSLEDLMASEIDNCHLLSLPFLYELKVVILNNAGHIYYTDRVNFGAATQCFVAVCSMVNNKSKISGFLSELLENEIDMMVSNVLMRYSITAPMA